MLYEVLPDGSLLPLKVGVSGGPVRADGKSVRAEKQARNLAKRYPGTQYRTEIIETASTRAEILEYEQVIVTIAREGGRYPNALPMNKRPLPFTDWPY